MFFLRAEGVGGGGCCLLVFTCLSRRGAGRGGGGVFRLGSHVDTTYFDWRGAVDYIETDGESKFYERNRNYQ